MVSRRLMCGLIPVAICLAGCSSGDGSSSSSGEAAHSGCTRGGRPSTRPADGSDCCNEAQFCGEDPQASPGCADTRRTYGGICPPASECVRSGQVTQDPGRCCAANGATRGLQDDNQYCNPVADCTPDGAYPPAYDIMTFDNNTTPGRWNDATYCCSARLLFGGVCVSQANSTVGPANTTSPRPDLLESYLHCVWTARPTSRSDGADCCASNGATLGGDGNGYCNPPPRCLPAGAAAPSLGGFAQPDYCCSGADNDGICCALTGQTPGSGSCCAGNGVDARGNCNPPAECTQPGYRSLSPNGSDCCSGSFAIDGICQ